SSERLIGRTPLETRLAPAALDVVVAKDGYVLKVEPIDLRAGSASKLEVRLAKDVAVPRSLTLLGSPALIAKRSGDVETLFNEALVTVVRLYYEEKDPRVLIDAAVKTTIEA